MSRVHARAIFVALVLGIAARQVSLSSMMRQTSSLEPDAQIPQTSLQSTLEVPVEAAPVEPILQAEISTSDASDENAVDESQSFYRVYRVTAYCDRGTTAAGVPSGVGQCAAPADIPFGSEIYIAELDRTFIVTDRTAKRFRHNTVDLYMPDRAECKRFGRNYLECQITPPAGKVGYASEELDMILASAQTKSEDKD